jgi:predicted regulator of Ras-like GTPase activity (Roadblock/LC7/MglB family)
LPICLNAEALIGSHKQILGDSMVKHDVLKTHLESLRSAIPELRGVLLASNEGLPVAHSLSNGTDPNRVAAMAAAASSLGRRISESMATGILAEVSIRGDDGMLFIYSAGPKAVLAVMGGAGSNAGLIHLESRTVAKDIGDLI